MNKQRFLRACAAGLFALCAQMAAAVQVSIFPADNIVDRGTQVDVLLMVSGLGDAVAPSLAGYDLDVVFDHNILSLVSVSFGDLLGDQLDLSGLGSLRSTTLGVGTVSLIEVSQDPADVLNDLQAGEFFLAALTFDTLVAGESALSITINQLVDSAGNSFVAATAPGRISVAVSAPGTMPLVMLGVGAALLVRRGRRACSARAASPCPDESLRSLPPCCWPTQPNPPR